MKKTLFLSAILGAILAVPTMAEVTYGGTIYTYTPKDGSNNFLHNATFTETTIVDGEFVIGTETVGYTTASANNTSDNTLRFVAGGTATTSDVQFNNLTIGGVVVDADAAITTLQNWGTRTFYIGVDNKTSGSSINKSFTIKTTAGSINLRGTQEIAIAASQTLTLSASQNIALNDNANVTVSGTGALAVNKTFTLGTGSTLALSDGMTLKLDNMPTGADRYDTITTSGITNRYAQYTLATGTGSVTRTGTQNATLNDVAKTITWADDNKSFEFSNGQVYQVIAGETKAVRDVNAAIAEAGVNTIVADGTLTGINATVSTASTTATIIGSGTVQVDGEFQYYNKNFLEDFTGTVEILSGETHIGDQGGKFSHVSAITLTGGALKGWSTTFGKNITLNGGSLSAAGNTMTYSGRVTINASSTIEGNGGQGTKLTGFVDAKAGDITIKGAVTSSNGFDMSGNGNRYTSNMLIKTGATFTSTSNLWVSNNNYNHTTFTLEKGGKFVKGGYTITGLEGGGTFVSGSTAALDMNGEHTLTNVAVVYNGDEATNSNVLAGTTTLKNTGTNLLTFNGTIGANATLEGVMDENGVSNVKYTKFPTNGFGTIKNVNIENLDAGSTDASITMDGVIGSINNGADIRTVNLIGNGLTLTNANKFTATLTGNANLIGSTAAMAENAAITIKGSAWTGTFKGRANAAISMNENSAASFEGGEGHTLTLTLKGNSYTGDHISDAVVSVTNTGAVTIANALTNVTLDATGKNVTLSGTAIGDTTLTNVALTNQSLTLSGTNVMSNIAITHAFTNNSTLTLKETVNYVGTLETNTHEREADNGYGYTTQSGTIIAGGTGSTNTDAVTAWQIGGSSENVTYADGIVTKTTETDTYYINDAATSAMITKDTTLVSNLGDTDFTNFISLSGEKALTITDGQVLKMSGDANMGVWMNGGSTVVVSNNASLSVFGITFRNATITNTSENTTAQIGVHEGGSGETEANRHNLTVSGDVTVGENVTQLRDYTFADANVTVASGTTTNINSALSATTDLTVNEGSTANFTKAGSIVKTLAGEGTVTVGENADLTVNAASTIKQLGGLGTVKALDDLTVKEGDVTLGGLEIAGGKTVTLGSAASHNHTLTLNNLTVAGSGSTINANLAISGGTMTMNSSVEMGCSVTLGLDSEGHVSKEALTLTDVTLNPGEPLGITILFTGVDSLTLGALGEVSEGWYDASTVFSTLTIGTGDPITIKPDKYVIGYWGTTVSISDKSVPEPATATLSLLALAALASRRRRK